MASRKAKPNSTKDLQAQSLRHAHNHGQPWSDDEVARLVDGIRRDGIRRDETSYEMALAVGRSYYSTNTARGHVRFALNHWSILAASAPKRKR